MRSILLWLVVSLMACSVVYDVDNLPDHGLEDGGAGDTNEEDVLETDAGSRAIPTLRFPWNGFSTGTSHAPTSAENHPLRPLFMWEPVESSPAYEVQMTRECTRAAFRSCLFATPDIDTRAIETTFRPLENLPISTSAPVGSRYYWRVRSCDGDVCGGWSEVRYLDVGRQSNDFDGDGYADLLVGAPFQNMIAPDAGAAYVYLTRGSAFSAETVPFVLAPAAESDTFGASVSAVGDVNGDGFADFMVGAGQERKPAGEDRGSAYLYIGGPTHVTMITQLPNPTMEAGRFGRVVGLGDINGDGFADVAIGAPRQGTGVTEEAGSVFVYLGGEGGLGLEPDINLSNPQEQMGGRFGRSVANAGDLDGDGFVDFVVGAPKQDAAETNAGSAFVYFGGVDIGARPMTVVNPAPQEDARFGISVAGAGDINGDGFSDLVVGADQQDASEADEGNVFVYLGAANRVFVSTTLDNPMDQVDGAFGFAVSAAGDVDGDGLADLVVGAYGQVIETRPGAAFFYRGTTRGLVNNPVFIRNPRAVGGFAFAVAGTGDLNGDGYDDLVIGGNQPTNEGRAFVYFGRSDLETLLPPVILDNPGSPGDDGLFGVAIGSPSL